MKSGSIIRHFGPCSPADAETLTERLLNSKALYQTLESFLRGDIEPAELAYSIQIVAENEEAALRADQEDERRGA